MAPGSTPRPLAPLDRAQMQKPFGTLPIRAATGGLLPLVPQRAAFLVVPGICNVSLALSPGRPSRTAALSSALLAPGKTAVAREMAGFAAIEALHPAQAGGHTPHGPIAIAIISLTVLLTPLANEGVGVRFIGSPKGWGLRLEARSGFNDLLERLVDLDPGAELLLDLRPKPKHELGSQLRVVVETPGLQIRVRLGHDDREGEH